MVKTMKRGLSLMFVLSLLVSMLVIPAKAAVAYTDNNVYYRSYWSGPHSTGFSFQGNDIQRVKISYSWGTGRKAPSYWISVPRWRPYPNWVYGTAYFQGGKYGDYYYDITLYNSAGRELYTTQVTVNVR